MLLGYFSPCQKIVRGNLLIYKFKVFGINRSLKIVEDEEIRHPTLKSTTTSSYSNT